MSTDQITHVNVPSHAIPVRDREGNESMEEDIRAEVLSTVPQQFGIDCEAHANWFVKKVRGCRDYAKHVREWAARELRRAEREESTLLFLFERQAEAWVENELLRFSGRRKSVSLPAGSMGFRATKSTLIIDDEEQVLSWARSACPQAVVTSVRISKSTLNEHFIATGELPAGTHVEPDRNYFYVR